MIFRPLTLLVALLSFSLAVPAPAATKKATRTPTKKAVRAVPAPAKPTPFEPFAASADGRAPTITAASAIVLDAATGQVSA